jgi:hypothetical protein
MPNITHFYIDDWKDDGTSNIEAYVLFGISNKKLARIYCGRNLYCAYLIYATKFRSEYSEHPSLAEAKQYIKSVLTRLKFKPLPNELKILL